MKLNLSLKEFKITILKKKIKFYLGQELVKSITK